MNGKLRYDSDEKLLRSPEIYVDASMLLEDVIFDYIFYILRHFSIVSLLPSLYDDERGLRENFLSLADEYAD